MREGKELEHYQPVPCTIKLVTGLWNRSTAVSWIGQVLPSV